MDVTPEVPEQVVTGWRIIEQHRVLHTELDTELRGTRGRIVGQFERVFYFRAGSEKSKLVCFRSSRSSFYKATWGSIGFSSGHYTASLTFILSTYPNLSKPFIKLNQLSFRLFYDNALHTHPHNFMDTPTPPLPTLPHPFNTYFYKYYNPLFHYLLLKHCL